MIIKLLRDEVGLKVSIDGREVRVDGLRPVDLLLAGLVYGLGVRFMDKVGVGEYSIRCDFNDDGISCEGICGGYEEYCLVFRIATKGLLRFNCLGYE